MSSFHQALQELQRSPLLAQAGVTVTAAEDTAGSELMAVATAASAAVATVQQHMQREADSSDWHGRWLEASGFVAFCCLQFMLLKCCWHEPSAHTASQQVCEAAHARLLFDGCWQQIGMTLESKNPSSSSHLSSSFFFRHQQHSLLQPALHLRMQCFEVTFEVTAWSAVMQRQIHVESWWVGCEWDSYVLSSEV